MPIESQKFHALAFVVARFMLGLVFIVSGIGKIIGYEGTVEFAAVSGVPAPHIAVILAAIAEIGLPILLIAGWKTRWAAIGLIVLVLATNYFFHQFWEMEGEGRTLNKIMFFKNFAIIGGLMLVALLRPEHRAPGASTDYGGRRDNSQN